MVNLFERPLTDGWIYPCTLDEIKQKLIEIPRKDLEGLWAVGLVPATRKNNSADGRYIFGPQPVIHLYSYPGTLTFKQPANVEYADITQQLSTEVRFGMQIEQEGSRWLCQWRLEDLRNFVIDYVLLHEIGHHVNHQQRQANGLTSCANPGSCEQFAEAYACRSLRSLQENTKCR